MVNSLNYLIANPFVALYCSQAVTYSVATCAAYRSRHRGLTGCYAASALLHGLLGTCHFLHLG
jgi:hypothetical protein